MGLGDGWYITPVAFIQGAVVHPSTAQVPGGGNGTEIIPYKDSHIRTKPLALASGHFRYMTVTPERVLVSRSDLKCPLELLESFMYNRFQGGDDGRGY